MDHTIIKEAATKIVANIKAMEDDITVLQNKQDIISTSDTTMTGSYPGRVSINEIGGKCEQFTTTGKQLYDVFKAYAGFINDIGEVVTTDTNRVSDYIASDGNITMSTNAVMESMGVAFYDSNKIFISRINKSKIDVINSESVTNCAYIRVWLNVDGAHLEATKLSTYKPMLNAGSTALPYEPYTGGQPSPNPDYPQEIKKTVVNEIKTYGKNLAHFPDVAETVNNGVTWSCKNGVIHVKGASTRMSSSNGVGVVSHMPIKKGTYTVSGGISGIVSVYVRVITADGTGRYEQGTFVLDGTEQTFYVYAQIEREGVTVDTDLHIQVEEGIVATEWQPYTESTITLSQPVELYGIGDVQDTIEDGRVVRRFDMFTFKGLTEEGWTAAATDNSGTLKRYGNSCLISKVKKATDNNYVSNMKCTQFSVASPNNTYLRVESVTVNTHGDLYVYNDAINTEDVSPWLEHLANNPMTVVYELAEPVIEDLPAVDQMALNSLSTYDGITYLEFDSEIEPTFQAEYGVTKIGGYALEGVLAGVNGTILGQSNTDRITALEATLVNNI